MNKQPSESGDTAAPSEISPRVRRYILKISKPYIMNYIEMWGNSKFISDDDKKRLRDLMCRFATSFITTTMSISILVTILEISFGVIVFAIGAIAVRLL